MRTQLKQIWNTSANDNISQTVDNLKVSDMKTRLDIKLQTHFQQNLDQFIDNSTFFELIVN